MNDILKEPALAYHRKTPPGKLELTPTKPCETQEDLSLAYSPGVAYPCLEISRDSQTSYTYTGRGNTVGIVTDGSAVLGLGNIGATASIPVMEGKCVLLKKFAGITGVPVALQKARDTEDLVHMIEALEPNFGAINLEDIKAPECFLVEEELARRMSIPVFHDDQHGTAIISLAGILNSLEIIGKNLAHAKIVIHGAGAAGIASASLYIHAGAKREHIILADTAGVIYHERRENMNKYKESLASTTSARTLLEALEDADVFVGVSAGNILTENMIKSMHAHPIIFALANPTPEIMPERAKCFGARIIATGRSDFPNQINNVLGFPGIFRGALDTRASRITNEMKLAAVHALIELTRAPLEKEIQEKFKSIYPLESRNGVFAHEFPLSEDYIVPKPFDPRVVPRVARFVARAAIEHRVAKITIPDLDQYELMLKNRIK